MNATVLLLYGKKMMLMFLHLYHLIIVFFFVLNKGCIQKMRKKLTKRIFSKLFYFKAKWY